MSRPGTCFILLFGLLFSFLDFSNCENDQLSDIRKDDDEMFPSDETANNNALKMDGEPLGGHFLPYLEKEESGQAFRERIKTRQKGGPSKKKPVKAKSGKSKKPGKSGPKKSKRGKSAPKKLKAGKRGGKRGNKVNVNRRRRMGKVRRGPLKSDRPATRRGVRSGVRNVKNDGSDPPSIIQIIKIIPPAPPKFLPTPPPTPASGGFLGSIFG